MKQIAALLAFLALCSPSSLAQRAKPESPTPIDANGEPVAVRRPVVIKRHGVTWTDEYAWLRAKNWNEVRNAPNKLAPAIRAHLEAEGRYTRRQLADTRTLQATLVAEMKGRILEEDATVPEAFGPWVYYRRTVRGGQHYRIARRPRTGGEEQTLLDVDALAKGAKSFDLSDGWAVSPDHKLLAYGVDRAGSETYDVRIRELATGKDLPDMIPQTNGRVAWSADSRALLYVKLDKSTRPLTLMRHRLGAPVASDAVLFKERDEAFGLDLATSLSGRFIIVTTGTNQSNEVRLIDTKDVDRPPLLITKRRGSVQNYVCDTGSRIYSRSSSGGALDFKVAEAEVPRDGEAVWRDVVPEQRGRSIRSLACYRNHIARLEVEDMRHAVVVRRLSDGVEHRIELGGEPHALEILLGFESDTTSLHIAYESMTTPRRVWRHDMARETREIIKESRLPNGHRPESYVSRQHTVRASDGVEVPVTLLHHESARLDGSAPLYLIGYGAYGTALKAEFDSRLLSLVDRGMIVALAHVRGGGEKGEAWYKAGIKDKKPRSIADFLEVAEGLITAGLTRRGSIILEGASAGGILVGAAVNQRPDLFLGAIAEVPFVDVLATMLDPSLPLTQSEYPEWGNPGASKADFDVIRGYAPYDNVKRQAYPHMLVTAALSDPRVGYWEPAKWVARLRALRTNRNLLLLDAKLGGGHFGATGRYDALPEAALRYAFALRIAGLMGVAPAAR